MGNKKPENKVAKPAAVNIITTFVKGKIDLKPENKLPPQARIIVEQIASVKDGFERGQLIARLKPLITTKQPVERILGYYQKRLIEEGYIYN